MLYCIGILYDNAQMMYVHSTKLYLFVEKILVDKSIITVNQQTST